MIIDEDAYLAHHGIKGMRWGVRKERETTPLDASDKEIVAKLEPHGYDSDRMRRMFGPSSDKPSEKDNEKFQLTDKQKRMLKTGAKVAVAAALVYGLHRYGESVQKKALGINDAPEEFLDFWTDHQKTSLLRGKKGFSPEFIEGLSSEPLTFSPGSILKRISTEAETDIRPGGFYAAFKDEDVQRYQAVLPAYWKQWGFGATEGHIVSLEAVQEVRAPSPKKTYEMFRDILDKPVDYYDFAQGSDVKTNVRDSFKTALGMHGADDETLMRRAFPHAALNWNDDDNQITKHFFERLRSEGFNAVVDINDAGSLSDTPMRVLDGSLFKIAGTEPLTKEAIATARDNILAFAHALGINLTDIFMHSDDDDDEDVQLWLEAYLEHHKDQASDDAEPERKLPWITRPSDTIVLCPSPLSIPTPT